MHTFDVIPVIADAAKAKVKVISLQGISTSHDGAAAHSDRGRLYGELTRAGATYTLKLFRSPARSADDLIASGAVGATGEYFDLAEANDSGVSGRAVIDSYATDSTSIVVIPTFCVDRDVIVDGARCANLPGHDPGFGLAELHSQAMRTILGDALPAAVPHLFGGTGLSALVANYGGDIPDLTGIASVDLLRVAQANLVKALVAEQSEASEEWNQISEMARKRFDDAMERLAAANTKDEDAAEERESVGPATSTWLRG